MRFVSDAVGGFQVFAVAGTNSVSFGMTADETARPGLLGFAVARIDSPKGKPHYLRGFKVFPSTAPSPTAGASVSTYTQPVQSLVWDDFTCVPGHTYTYLFHPVKGTPSKLDRSAASISVVVTTEPLYGQTHDVFVNRGIASSQDYATKFNNLAPDKQPTPALQKAALAWLARDLETALITFIRSAKRGDALRGCFYEFTYLPVLAEFKAALDRGVDLKLVVDEKENSTSDPRTENLDAITASGLDAYAGAIVPRLARKSAIAHNKFMVLLPGGAGSDATPAKPTEVWTGSTNLTDGGIYGQANVGHWVRDATLAQTFLDYWTLLSTDPGGATGDSAAAVKTKNAALYANVAAETPVPPLASIPTGVTALFSPRSGTGPLDLYEQLLVTSTDLSCATFPFTIAASFKAGLSANTPAGPLVFLLLDQPDKPPKTSTAPYVTLNSRNNVYEASGSEIETMLGRWVVETDATKLGLTTWVTFIHAKFMLHDPLGADPIVVSGSANFSLASTETNDENMIVVRGDRRVADIYFTEFNRLFNHYYFRSVTEATAGKTPAAGSISLVEDDSWLEHYGPGMLRTKRVQVFAEMSV